MGIFTLFSTNFNYILYPFPFLCPKIQLIRFFFGTQTPRAGTHHTHYDIYFPRYPLNRPARPIPSQHQWSSPTNMAPMPPHPRGQLPSYFNTRRLLQPRRQLQCQVGHPLPQNSRLSGAENRRNWAITLWSQNASSWSPPTNTPAGSTPPGIRSVPNGAGSIAASQSAWKGQFHAHNHHFWAKYATSSSAANAIGGF